MLGGYLRRKRRNRRLLLVSYLQRSDYVAHVHAHARAVYYVKDKNLGLKVKIFGVNVPPVPYAGYAPATLRYRALSNPNYYITATKQPLWDG